jgi:hypothetical protein
MIHKTITPWDRLLETLLTVNQVLFFMDHGMMQIHLDRLKESCEFSKDYDVHDGIASSAVADPRYCLIIFCRAGE